MGAPVIAALAAAALVAIVDWAAVWRGVLPLERVTRPAVMVALLAAVLLSDQGSPPARWLLAAALAASLVGDWLLLPPVRFTGGLAAFLLAQLAYLALFLLGKPEPVGAVVGVATAAGLLLAVARPIVGGAARAGVGVPVVVYLAAICAMAVAATASGSAVATVGAWLFVASDAMLGWDRFAALPAATPRAAAARRLAIIASYHAAQVLLTVAVLGSPAS